MGNLNCRYKVQVSHKAFLNMRSEASSRGFGCFAYMRHKAYTLIKTVDPKFEISGHALLRTAEVGLADYAWEGLQVLAKDLGVPEEAIGELICSFVLPVPKLAVAA